MVQNILNNTNTEQKETLVENLDLEEDEETGQ